MKARFLMAMCASLLLLAGAASSHAQSIKSYLDNSANSVLRIELTTPPQAVVAPTSWLGKLRLLLGIRNVARIKPEIGTVLLVQASAYASSPYQTDSTPCVTAAGTRVRPGVVASNFLPLGTILEIQGEKFIVEDRMNSRYDGYFMDIWFPSTSSALEFGRRKLSITVVGYGEPGQEVRIKEQGTPADSQTTDEPGFWSKLINKLVSASEFITAKVSPNANRHDVNCDEEAAG